MGPFPIISKTIEINLICHIRITSNHIGWYLFHILRLGFAISFLGYMMSSAKEIFGR